MFRLAVCVLAFLVTAIATSAPPEIMTITYEIDGTRRSMGKAVAIGPNLVVSADHVVRDDESSLGPVIAVDRKWDRCLIRRDNDDWSELRRTPVSTRETLHFEGGTCRLNGRGSMTVTSGQAVPGMSGGPIWDSEGRVVALVCEGRPDQNILWGYTGLSEWVDENRPERRSADKDSLTVQPATSVDSLKARIAALVNRDPEPSRSSLRDRIAAYERDGGRPWYVNGGQTSVDHLVRTHGWSRSELRGLSDRELNLFHGASHTGVMSAGVNHPETPDSSTLMFFTRPNCPPCDAFEASALPTLESKGWRVETVRAPPGVGTPTFEYRGERWTGYTSSSAFYRRLREAMRARHRAEASE